MYLPRYTIYGERCSGTNYLQDVIEKNFEVKVTWEFGWKHFFGFQEEELKRSDDTLFICIIRDIQSWLNSFYREMHHLPLKYVKDISEKERIRRFLEDEIYSINDADVSNKEYLKEIMTDRNIYSGERYKNIFELRYTKNKFMKEDLPKKVKHYIFIHYEDLLNNFNKIMNQIKEKGLKVKEGIHFPLNSNLYKNSTDQFYIQNKNKNKKKDVLITKEMILKYI